MKEVPESWPAIVKLLEEYTPQTCTKVVFLKHPTMGSFKCNVDGWSKRNPGKASIDFYVRDGAGELVYVESRKLGYDVRYWGWSQSIKGCPLTIETYSLNKEDIGWCLGHSLSLYQ